ncbi:hypothetical protein [Chitinophaga eiseniae]|uniref:Uncharacterized protein n=1 Tax=Chitinophaga eiseniae TaxID=634771 RepID=A0A847SLP6_9BACT|nr:hypothetical protein [Chitinophaga eiseniae]NLR78306.1 hypothetical protein [Chitinophaga eiseniae]
MKRYLFYLRNLRYIIVVVIMHSCITAKQGGNKKILGSDSVFIVYDTIGDPAGLVTLRNRDSIFLLFKGSFEDTINVKLNNVAIGKFALFRKNYRFPNQSDIANLEIGLCQIAGDNIVEIYFLNMKKHLKFKLASHYPICLIEYTGTRWIVRFRRHTVMHPVEINIM